MARTVLGHIRARERNLPRAEGLATQPGERVGRNGMPSGIVERGDVTRASWMSTKTTVLKASEKPDGPDRRRKGRRS